MSRRLPSTHCRTTSDNPYQPTTVPAPHGCAHHHHHLQHERAPYRNGHTVIDTALSDDTLTDSYDLYHKHYASFSDESDDCRRMSRNSRKLRENPAVHKDVRRVYPQGLYQEVPTQQIEAPRRPPDRPQSSMSSGVTSAIVDGCGGKCQTFENVCYFFLQLVFMMGILIGVSLCIAGLVLRKSAARNLQVLVYIGILLGIVSGVLLGIQWNARHVAKKRKMAVRNAKRGPIPLETLQPRGPLPMVAVQEGQRVVPQVLRPVHDQQGIPWWRRKDLV
ncbi:uncharacterized protein LOC103313936 [Tribolium castaneum]|uniref:Uncharacterized protein n=1 Tax=Tribolium castaneum TaxID=7070 RepID=D6WW28_TRICA|nr:PREDICTED: uncharacterized protein LOC103313936 [Tribolium castaneum]XP_008196709.1 PREDICTED: uncharacterized protein LOC103313936 [Tribolium castaneum]EFA08654.1 hypothetical protein TcasGA2_TC006319 [Tribolium castaneum]|eukprot:XP_008196708.1 PREDICTED: uncharacterized protein LOC103313936 [Tribolium castaneum]